MSLPAVRAWRDAMRADLDGFDPSPLSGPAAHAAVEAALDSWTDDALAAIASLPGTPYRRAGMVAPRTVSTAPLEWCAGWALSGTAVVWKHPQGRPGLAPWAAQHARAQGLDIQTTDDRRALDDTEVIVGMGSDDTVADLVRIHGHHARVLGFGHRFSAAWWPADHPPDPAGLAQDLLLHDGRGCMTPAVVLTDAAPDTVLDALAPALDTQAQRWPGGLLAESDHARRRARRTLAALAGGPGAARTVRDVDLVVLPATLARPEGLPRSVVVVPVADRDAAVAWLRPWSDHLSAIVQDRDALPVQPGARTARPGTSQRPPLGRRHDGTPMVHAWRRPEG